MMILAAVVGITREKDGESVITVPNVVLGVVADVVELVVVLPVDVTDPLEVVPSPPEVVPDPPDVVTEPPVAVVIKVDVVTGGCVLLTIDDEADPVDWAASVWVVISPDLVEFDSFELQPAKTENRNSDTSRRLIHFFITVILLAKAAPKKHIAAR
jgi:hypothetical protein